MKKIIGTEKKLKVIKDFVYNLLYANLSRQMNRNPEVVFDNDSVVANIKSPKETQCEEIEEISQDFVNSLKAEKSKKIRMADINYFYEEASDISLKGNYFLLFIFTLCLSPFAAWIASKFGGNRITAAVGICVAIISLLGMIFNVSDKEKTHLHNRFWLWYDTRNDGKMKS